MSANRKSYNLAIRKLALYEKWYKLLSHHGSRLRRDEETGDVIKTKRFRQSRFKARKYYKELIENYKKIKFPLDDENKKIEEFLGKKTQIEKEIYIMRTGFSKGISFSNSQISRVLKISLSRVEEIFSKVTTEIQNYFYLESESKPDSIIIEINNLTPELIKLLKANSEKLEDLSWQIYEQLIGEFFASWGYYVSFVGSDSSTGADIIAIKPPDPSGISHKYFIEVKRWKDRVGVEVVDRVIGAIFSERPNQGFHAGVIVASSGFKDFKKYTPEQLQLMGVELRDNNHVKDWLNDYRPSENGLWIKM